MPPSNTNVSHPSRTTAEIELFGGAKALDIDGPPIKPAPKRPDHRLDWCDGLRGWFALLVLWHHFGSFYRDRLPSAFELLIGPGFAVSMNGFLVLSSFLLTNRLASEMQSYKGNARECTAIARIILYFCVRRVFRIYPLFWFMAAFSFRNEAYCLDCIQMTADDKLRFLSLWDVQNSFFWTLSVEMKSYTVIPLVCIAWRYASRSLYGRIAIFAALVCLIAVTNYVWGSHVEPGSDHLPWLTVFLSGSTVGLIFLCLAEKHGSLALPRYRVYLLSVVAILLFVTMHAITSSGVGFIMPGMPEVTYFTIVYTIYPGYIIALAFLCAILAGENEPCFKRFFALGCMRYIGTVSYSLYLLQFFVINFTTAILPETVKYGLIHLTVLTAAGVAVATITYRAIELPAMNWGAKFVKLLKRQLETVTNKESGEGIHHRCDQLNVEDSVKTSQVVISLDRNNFTGVHCGSSNRRPFA